MRQQDSIEGLLGVAARVLREITGFDRVMGYRFRPDDSGDVVVEERVPELPPYLGWRYPASDIPAQARRLYTVNPMRLIADVGAAPVALQPADPRSAPLDLSHAVLRAVSPIHIEYLRNIGVGASMSLSIVLEGRLWGMLACHHRTPRQVPYAVRSACVLLAELLAAHLQARLALERGAEQLGFERLHMRVLDKVQHADDPVTVLRQEAHALAEAYAADAVIVARNGGLAVHGDVPPALVLPLVRWLARQAPADGLLVIEALGARAPELAELADGWAGVLAVSYDQASHAVVALLRREQQRTIDWGHDPNKSVQVGPLGPRLTPPGSFALWRETVRGRAEPWGLAEQQALRELGHDLRRSEQIRRVEIGRHRALVETLLSRHQAPAADGAAGPVADAAAEPQASRIDALLHKVVELTALRERGLQLRREPLELGQLVTERVDHLRGSVRGAALFVELPGGARPTESVAVTGDRARLTQLVDELLDNAMRYGSPGEAVVVRLACGGATATLEVSNISPPLPAELVQAVFSGVPAQALADDARSGLGFGLYTARTIAQAHGGDIGYAYDDPFVTMSVQLPLDVREPA